MSKVLYQNPNLVVVTLEMGERYAECKTRISWAQGEDRVTAKGHSLPSILELRQTMDALHRAWPAHSRTADANFPALLDQFEASWHELMEEYKAELHGDQRHEEPAHTRGPVLLT